MNPAPDTLTEAGHGPGGGTAPAAATAGITRAARLLSPEQIAVQAGQQVPFLHLPEPRLFAERALRLRQLAAGHPMRDYLLLCALLCEAQQARLDAALQPGAPALRTPDAAALQQAAQAGLPPLPAGHWPREPAWRDDLRALLALVHPQLPPGPARDTVARVRDADADWLEQQARGVLTETSLGLDLAAAPLVGAGLQLHFTRLVLQTQRQAEAAGAAGAGSGSGLQPFGRVDDASRCPCCGSRPTASLLRLGAESGGYRYLHCALCSSQWHLVRVKCSHCLGTAGIGYQQLQALAGHSAAPAAAREGAVQAETCEPCGHYLKILRLDKDPHLEPVADDLATLTLDLLVGELGLYRHGSNLLLAFGESAADGDASDADAPDGDGHRGGTDAAPPPGARPPDPGAP